MSSTHSATRGNQSDTSMPDLPCFWNVRLDASSLFLSTPRRVLTGPNDSGNFCPCSLVSPGFGSNVSTCDGPPDMNRKMTFLALPLKCGFFGASGSTSANSLPSSANIAASASEPNPQPAERRKVRRSSEVNIPGSLAHHSNDQAHLLAELGGSYTSWGAWTARQSFTA